MYNASVSQRPDPINAVDSETGSILKSLTRRTVSTNEVKTGGRLVKVAVTLTLILEFLFILQTSEELFISGRSSVSYESCIIDEDAVVPNWLFNIINHQYPVRTISKEVIVNFF